MPYSLVGPGLALHHTAQSSLRPKSCGAERRSLLMGRRAFGPTYGVSLPGLGTILNFISNAELL
jgi:hypothetical protein